MGIRQHIEPISLGIDRPQRWQLPFPMGIVMPASSCSVVSLFRLVPSSSARTSPLSASPYRCISPDPCRTSIAIALLMRHADRLR